MQLLAKNIIKFPKTFLPALLEKRNLVNKYEKHNELKIYSYYFLIKAITTSGTIHNFSNQKSALRKYFKVTRNTFNSIISKLEIYNLIKLDGDDLKISSWQQAAEILNCDYSKNYFSTTYLTNNKQPFYYSIFALDIANNQAKQAEAIQKKISANSSILEAILNSLSELTNRSGKELKKLSWSEFSKLLMEWQKKTFTYRTAHFKILHSIRIDCNRSLKNLRNAWSVKDFRTATYIKRKLEFYKIITNDKQEIVFSDSGNRMIQVSKNYCDIYNPATKKRAYRLCDQLNLNIEFSM